jgi:beta-aspartyl-peptidase (threonine type)
LSALSIIVHGGAKEIPPAKRRAHRDGCLRAAEAGWTKLEAGGTAVDALEAAIRVLEDDPTFNAGYGSDLNAEGEVQMDAGFMHGKELKSGAVAYIQGVKNPISVARRVFEQQEILLVGDGAYLFAKEFGAEICPKSALITEEKRGEWEQELKQASTVGCVVIDRDGNIAAGASTGGTGSNRRGRVGDTPMPGCGYYAENSIGGVAMTGDGEEIARVVLSKVAIDFLSQSGNPEAACAKAIKTLQQKVGGEAGCIMLDCNGKHGWHHNSRDMAVAYRTEDMKKAVAFTRKSEEAGR